MAIFAFYTLISISFFLSIIAKAFFTFGVSLEVVSSLFNSQLNRLILINLCCVIVLQVIVHSLNYFLKGVTDSQWNDTVDEIKSIFFDIFFPTISLNNSAKSLDFILIPIPYVLRFIAILTRNHIEGLSISQHSKSVSFHQRLFSFQIIIFSLCLYTLFWYYHLYQIMNNHFLLVLSANSCTAILIVISDLLKHIYFLQDMENEGASDSSYRKKCITGLIQEALNIIVDTFLIFNTTPTMATVYFLKSYVINGFYLALHSIKYHKWSKLSAALDGALPSATYEDIRRESSCIICRLEMKPWEAKRLPCGHCYHLWCLQSWIRQQMSCPLCQYNLRRLLNPQATPQELILRLLERDGIDVRNFVNIDVLNRIDDNNENILNDNFNVNININPNLNPNPNGNNFNANANANDNVNVDVEVGLDDHVVEILLNENYMNNNDINNNENNNDNNDNAGQNNQRIPLRRILIRLRGINVDEITHMDGVIDAKVLKILENSKLIERQEYCEKKLEELKKIYQEKSDRINNENEKGENDNYENDNKSDQNKENGKENELLVENENMKDDPNVLDVD